jgi:ABC-type Co2+ transport system permease subunit
MHIEPGLVDSTKIVLSYATAAGALGWLGKLSLTSVKEQGISSLLQRTLIATLAVFTFFQVFPHYPLGVSEVHFILGSTLFLLFGAAPAGAGLALGLLLQGVLFEPKDIPQYGMNVTSLLVPLFGLEALARRIIAPGTAYVDISYGQALKLSTAFQAGVVGWVAFWVFYGQGFSAETFTSLATFGGGYMSVVLGEPLVDLVVLAGAKLLHGLKGSRLVTPRLYSAG